MGYLTAANIDGSDYRLAGALYGTCSTGASTAAKIVACPDFDSLETGVTIHVKFTNHNSAASPSLNVNSTGAAPIKGIVNVAGVWSDNSVVSFTYDGESWIMNDTGYIDTKNTAGSTNSASKLFLIGATSQAANPQTYSNTNVYETNGTLHALHMEATTFNDVAINRYNDPGIVIVDSQDASTALRIPSGHDYTLGDACEKTVDTSIASGSTSTNLPTTAAVADYVDDAVATATAGGLVYKGTATALTDITDTNYKKGWYWMVGTNPSITIDGQACEAGDMVIAKQDKTATADNDLDVIQTNIVALTTAEIDADWAAA